MAYTTNPHAGKARGDAVRLVKIHGWSKARVARYCGVSKSTIGRWVERAPDDLRVNIPTESSRPKHSPNALDPEVVAKILELRVKHRDRCAPVIHQHLLNEGLSVSLSTVRRTLKREGYIREKSPWKRFRPHIERPLALFPGALVQTDTIHIINPYTNKRFYVYTAIDLFSRKAFAMYSPKISAWTSLAFIKRTEGYLGFKIQTLQADNGPEFGRWLTDELKYRGTTLRHSRVRKPNDNAHIERFNRTIQEECFENKYIPPEKLPRLIKSWLSYYNNDRLHLSIGLITPQQQLEKVAKVLT